MINFLKRVLVDDNEKEFISNNGKNLRNNKKIIIVNAVKDYYYLINYKLIIKKKCYSTIFGVWPYCILSKDYKKKDFFYIKYFLKEILNRFEKKKWDKLYRSIGIKLIYNPEDKINFINKFLLFYKALFYFKKIKSKEDVFSLKVENIKIGDLVYDTYLRFRCKPTLNPDDFFLILIIYKAFIFYFGLKKITKEINPEIFYTSYTSYIHHGISARFFLKKKIKVISGANNSQYNKKLSSSDNLHSENFKSYKINFSKEKNKKNKIKQANLLLAMRFNGVKGNVDSYLKFSPYREVTSDFNKLENIQGIIFPHCFVDSPHGYGKMIFPDFYTWLIYTLDFFENAKNYNIAVKTHPNSTNDTLWELEKVKKKYNKFLWLDKNYSNQVIMKSNFNFGISCVGSVIYELAYFKKKSISCGDHVSMSFNFNYNAKSINQYQYFLKNRDKLKLKNFSKNEIAKFYYMYAIKNNDYEKNYSRDLDLKNYKINNSKKLIMLDNLINNKYAS